MSRIAVDDRELRAMKTALAAWCPPGEPVPACFPVLAIDPGKRSMGWAVVDAHRKLHSGEGTPKDVVRELDGLLELVGPPILFACEAPYSVSAAQIAKTQHRSGGVSAVYALARATGYVEGGLRRHLLRSTSWEPKPMTWRAVLGLNRRSEEESGREATAKAMLMWARATTRLPLKRHNDEDQIDRAMAIGIAFAGLGLLTSVMASMRPTTTPARKPRPTGRQQEMPLNPRKP
jgi:hypothetical protein